MYDIRQFKHTVEVYRQRTTKPMLVVVNDLRFRREAQELRAMGARLIRLKRAPYPDPSVSEVDLDGYEGFHAEIDNADLTPEQTQKAALGWLNCWRWLYK